MLIGHQLKDLRKRSRLKQGVVASKVGITSSYLCKIESGIVKNPSWSLVETIFAAIRELKDENRSKAKTSKAV